MPHPKYPGQTKSITENSSARSFWINVPEIRSRFFALHCFSANVVCVDSRFLSLCPSSQTRRSR